MGKPLPSSLAGALAALRAVLGPCGDITFRPLSFPGHGEAAAIVYCTSLTDVRAMEEHLLQPLMNLDAPAAAAVLDPATSLIQRLEQASLPIAQPHFASADDDVVRAILKGAVALLTEGSAGAVLVRMNSQLARGIIESKTEGVVRGPRDAFVEQMETNLLLLRRHLPVTGFRLERLTIGKQTQTEVAIVWLDGLPKPGVLDEVRKRLARIEIDGVLESAYLEELIEDHPYSPFPTIDHTERPDKVVANLLEGRVTILTGGSPFALILPITLAQFLQAAEDYYERYVFANAIRLIRLMAFWLALTLPSIWVAVTTYHHEMIPSALFVALAASREGVPWPAIVEALLMEISFELLREAGLRLPKPVGQAVSIVGGLVVGEAAIRANIASPGMVIVVALTGIASFAIPAYGLALTLRLLRFPIMILAATLGMHGVVVGLMMLFIHLAGLRSFGVPYLAPFSPATPSDWKDTLVRAPRWAMARRPGMLSPGNRRRAPAGQMPRRGGA